MARSFNASTDGVKVSGGYAATTKMSAYGWVKNPIATGTAAKMLWCHGDAWRISLNAEKYGGGTPTAGSIYFGRSWSTTDHYSQVGSPGATWANWNHIAVTYDGSVNTNTAKIYLNGVLLTNSSTRNAVGTIDNAVNVPTVGNDVGLTLSCQGTVAMVGFHDDVLTVNEIQQAMLNGYVLRNLYQLHTLYGDATPEPDLSGNGHSAAITGTTVALGPQLSPLWIPADNWNLKQTSAAVASNISWASTSDSTTSWSLAMDEIYITLASQGAAAGTWTLQAGTTQFDSGQQYKDYFTRRVWREVHARNRKRVRW